jgi:hypothetical protein
MSIGDEIAKLRELHRTGALSDPEFARAKERILSGSLPPSQARPLAPDRTLGHAANRFVSFYMVMAVVGVVLFLAMFFGFFKPQWDKSQSDFDRRWDESNKRFDEQLKSGPKLP